MTTYRDYLDKRGVPSGPWCVNERGDAIVDRNAKRQDNEDWLGPKDESDGARSAIAQRKSA